MTRSMTDDIYAITVAGTYSCKTKEGLEERNYEVTFKLPESEIQHGAVSLFAKHIAPKVMPVQYPGYSRLITHELISAVPPGNKRLTNPALMNRLDLENYIQENDLDIITEVYSDDGSLRQAIEDLKADLARGLGGLDSLT